MRKIYRMPLRFWYAHSRLSAEAKWKKIELYSEQIVSFLHKNNLGQNFVYWINYLKKYMAEKEIPEKDRIRICEGVQAIIAIKIAKIRRAELEGQFRSSQHIYSSRNMANEFIKSHPEVLDALRAQPGLLMYRNRFV